VIPEEPEKIPAGSVDNAMRTLQLLRDRGSLRVSEVARELSVARSTAHRLMSQLSAYGVVEQDPGSPRYHAGPLLAQLGLATFRSRDLVEQMHPYLERLSDEVSETVHLIGLEGRDAVFIDSVESRGQALRVAARVGIVYPAYVNSGGKALLAQQSDDAVRRLYADTTFGSTSRTIPSLEALIDELRQTRERGYATTRGDRELGLAAVAVVQRSREDVPVAAIAISAPEQRLPHSRLEALVKALRATAEQAADQLL
jgi:DNA-binding IclR family transcriptional regulator